ncbi:beta-ketoacyl synthase [Calothrix sp. NIES-4101]|nr:beta-ketoacyl synthase [Calothrix sp. NIES-4101]
MNTKNENEHTDELIEGIAIIGMAGRFPGARNIEDFWKNLCNSVESLSPLENEELLAAGVTPALINNTNYVKRSGILEDIDLFDAAFFDINPKEAELTDPQHRLFLECAWQALENAGYDSTKCESRIGVYAGASLNNYLSFDLNKDGLGSAESYQKLIGNDKDFLSTRVSYKLNLKGPSITVQTACSTSLVATILAYQSLQSYQCDIALAGGVSIRVPQKTGFLHQQGGTLSPDGHCRAFDAKAQGTTIGNGVGVVVLKRLSDAIADRDNIYAVIKGTAINNDGSLKVGFTAPSVDGQAEAIAEAIALADIEPETINYIEAHGTGTSLGDPIEIAALTKVFRARTAKKGFCAIGSVKTNIGHLDAAAGIAGLIKTSLALKHQLIPPSLNFEQPNPQIDFANSPFFVNTKLREWEANSTPRRAGVSSLGMGGTNAHAVLEEAPLLANSSPSRAWQLLLLSAKTTSALKTATENLLEHLHRHPHENLADVAYTLQLGRREFNYRRMLVCCDVEDAINGLSEPLSNRVLTQLQEPSDNRSIAFMFPGQGSQYIDMGKKIYETEPIFRQHLEHCSLILTPHLGLDLRSLIYPTELEKEAAAEKLKQTCFAQPALFVIEYALAQLWISWGVSPQAMIGHSIGEYVAATLAGVFSLTDALVLVANRGKLMQQLPEGAMLSVQLSQPEIEPLLRENISLAAVNTVSYCTVSGTTEAIEELQQHLHQLGVTYRRLHTSHAFHSQMMVPILETFTQLLQKVKLNPPEIPFISNVSGTWISTSEATNPHYWATHLRQTVHFHQGITELLKTQGSVLLEVGPGRTLSTFAKQQREQKLTVLTSLPHPQEQQSDLAFLLNTLGRLWMLGIQIDWSGFYVHEQRHRLPLPTYPFERQRYLIEPKKPEQNDSQTSVTKQKDIADWFYIPRWQQSPPIQFFQKENFVAQKSPWLVFVDTYGVGVEIAERLKQKGEDVIVVEIADNFAQLSDRTYTINPQQRDDYVALLQALRENNWNPQAIAHFYSVTPNDTLPKQGLDEEKQLQELQLQNKFFEDCQNLGFYSLLFLTQALAQQNLTDSIKLMVVTSNINDVTGSEKLCPEKATILAPCKVIPQEYPNITCCCFDVEFEVSQTQVSNKLIDSLLREFTTQPTENVIAYRGHHRWIQTYESIHLEQNSLSSNKLRTGGVYLILGGLGDVGLVLAEYLAQTVQAKLILLGRKGLPETNQWQEWLATHDQEDSISRKIRKVQSLLALGAEVLVVSADIANEQQMHDAIAIATQKFGTINGVIHAAGEKVGCTIVESSKIQVRSQFNSKVYGLFVLAKVLQGQKLDFCQLTSSLASMLGGLGFVSYSAANIFMDAFVQNYNKTSSFPWSSFNWDNWVTEDELQNPEIMDISHQSLYRYGMASKAASIDAFARILSMCGCTQVVVSSGDLQTRVKEWIELESLRTRESSNNESLSLKHQRPNLGIEYTAPRNKAEETITNIWQEILGIGSIGIHDNFFELGGNSINAIQIAAKANQCGLKLTPQDFFEHQTIAELAVNLWIPQANPSIQDVQSSEMLQEQEYWLQEIQKPFSSLPIDFANSDRTTTTTTATIDIVSVCLDEQETKALLDEIHKAYNTQINDVLLTAIVEAFAEWTGERKLRLDIRDNSREKTFNSLSTYFPVVLDITASTNQENSLITIKEYLRSIPKTAISDDIYNDLYSKKPDILKSEVIFNYLGQYDQRISPESLFSSVTTSEKINHSTSQLSNYLLEINGIVIENKLEIYWLYNQAIYRQETIKNLAGNFIEELRSLIYHCQSLEKVVYTTSDFPGANLSQENLNQLLAKIQQTSEKKANESRKY